MAVTTEAVHAAVEDAGEHDERVRRLHPVGEGQQQRDGHRRADAGQDPDGGAHGDADERDEQARRRQNIAEPVEQAGQVVDHNIPWSIPAGRLTPSPIANP
jgi:hypothetical protein